MLAKTRFSHAIDIKEQYECQINHFNLDVSKPTLQRNLIDHKFNNVMTET